MSDTGPTLPFVVDEYVERLRRVREAAARVDVDVLVVTRPDDPRLHTAAVGTRPRSGSRTRWQCSRLISSSPTSTRRPCAALERHLQAASVAGELRDGTDVKALAALIETTYHGAMIGWALHREGTLTAWMREQLEAVVRASRTSPS